MKKKLLWIDHYFHTKTKSTLFLEEILESEYEISKIYLKENNQKIIENDLTNCNSTEFDVIILFQLYPDRQSLDLKITYKKGVFVPMIDGCPPIKDIFWIEYSDYSVLNFCKYLEIELLNHGKVRTAYFQYFPKPKEITDLGDAQKCYFWQRRGEISTATIEKVLGKQVATISLNTSSDPEIRTTKVASKLYKINKLEWLPNPNDLDLIIQQSKFYFAPREFEGIGQSFLNAMNLGRIVVALDNPTMNEYIKNKKTGFLYPLDLPKEVSFDEVSLETIQKNVKDYMNVGYEEWVRGIPRLIQWIGQVENFVQNKNHLVIDAGIFRYFQQNGSSRTGIFKSSERIVRYLLSESELKISFYTESSLQKDVKLALESLFGDLLPTLVILSESSNFDEVDAFLSLYENFPDCICNHEYIKKYCIVNDCIPQMRFASYGENFPWFFKLQSQLKLADKIFAISEYTKADLIKLHPELDRDSIKVCYLGDPLEGVCATLSREDVYKYLGLGKEEKYCLSVCSLEPRKNLKIVIESFFNFIEKFDIKDLKLVLAGPKWESFEGSFPKELLMKINASKYILFAGYVSDELLKSLYAHALFFVYTSQYEGFGLPLVEAMNSGTPVVASNATSIPEVVGQSCLLVSPFSICEHVNAYKQLYYDGDLRKKLAASGRERGRNFSWKKCSQEISEFIEKDFQLPKIFPSLTVVMVTFNLIRSGRMESFKRALNSVRNQYYPNGIEVVVVDGASTDGSLEMLSGFKTNNQIDVLLSEPDSGLYDAMNKGIRIAKGDFICFLNSDDYYHNKFGLFTSVKRICLNKLDYSFADALVVDLVNNKKLLWKGNLAALPLGSHYCHQTMICKKQMLKVLEGFDCSYKISSDSDLCIRAVANGFRGSNVGINFVTYSAGLGISSDEKIVREEHSRAFYEHIGRKSGLSRLDCFNLWNLKGFLSLNYSEAILILSKLQNPEWIQFGILSFNNLNLPFSVISPSTPGEKVGRKVAVLTDLLLKKRICNILARKAYKFLKPIYIKSKPYLKKLLN